MSRTTRQKQFTLREEPFGYTLYNKNKLKHQFILKHELSSSLEKNGISRDDYEYLETKHKNYRKDIIYSPIRIYYELTLLCDLRCHSCFNSSGKPRPYELSTTEVIESLHHSRENNVLDIRFTGGELTLRPDWYEILKPPKN